VWHTSRQSKPILRTSLSVLSRFRDTSLVFTFDASQGFDPFLVHGFLTVACLGLSPFLQKVALQLTDNVGIGVLIGPTLGGALWRWTHRRQVDLIDEKDREFLERIAKNRVDPSLQTATAPVPDYYGAWLYSCVPTQLLTVRQVKGLGLFISIDRYVTLASTVAQTLRLSSQWLRDQNKYRRKVLLPEKEED